jgi:hypothetical protein
MSATHTKHNTESKKALPTAWATAMDHHVPKSTHQPATALSQSGTRLQRMAPRSNKKEKK